ncbi:salicylate biosynthesis isochorismate synthase [Paraliobacillus ryukyuensis]|uniref:Isochorismate synthase MenF n=1 Tax=Paraliobacillus ryukyuensis TaxID=200904 RepID=A0A366E729_9BACI|nr:isochorismate synthase [Paraliobacillus ryukyuensis]RBO98122.1 isochorismate synthase [Paraliobacillus ryukyuensis]
MIETTQKPLDILIDKAMKTAKNQQIEQIISLTEKINDVDPFTFFDQAKVLGDNRFFWSSATDDFYLVGAGEAYTLQANTNAYYQIEQQWKHVLDRAFIHNSYRQPGTGFVAFGGFPFDPTESLSQVWDDFDGSHFRIPSYLLARHNGEFFLTMNIVVSPQDKKADLLEQIEQQKVILLSNTAAIQAQAKIAFTEEVYPMEWKETVKKATEEIKQGKAAKIVLARAMNLHFDSLPVIQSVLKELMRVQTRSFIFAYEQGDSCFIGATPERLVRVEQEQVFSACLAGTAPRGKTTGEDQHIADHLLHDRKNREEHDYVVEMIEHALTDACESVYVPDQPVIYPLKNLQHLYTPVTAKLKKDYSILDIVKNLHPTPALGGLPREASLSFIRSFEALERGWYGAPIGWFDANQNGEFGVAIRSGLLKGKTATLFAGCGVVKDSDPDAEYQETVMKFAPMRSALRGENT